MNEATSTDQGLGKPLDVERVIKDDMRFKAKLAIGENAYAELRSANAVRKYWDLIGAVGGGAAVAKTSLVAAIFGTASTPIGWVIAAAAISGGAWYGMMHTLGGATGSRVTVIPKCINTPLDIIGTKLFDLMMPLALKVATADGEISEQERQCIRRYFVDQWGYDPTFVDAGMVLIEPVLNQFKILNVAEELVAYKIANPDCNYEVMSRDILDFLIEVMESDGVIDEREDLVLKRVEGIFAEAGRKSFGTTLVGIKDGLTAKAKVGARIAVSGANVLASTAASTVDVIAKSEAFGNLKEGAGRGVEIAADSIRSASSKAVSAMEAVTNRLKR